MKVKKEKITDPFEIVEREQETKIFKNKDMLDPSHVPKELPAREKEIVSLKWYLKDALEGNKPRNIFIYGYTGVGKTACCRKVLRDLQEKITEQNISGVRTMYLNCATTHSESRVVGDVANFFATKTLAPRRGWATSDYYRFFGNTLDDLGGIFILLLDEVDKLIPHNENLLYNFTRASDHILSNAKISLVGISNDLKFYDCLDPRIKSSMCQREIIINPYNAPQLRKILSQRAKDAFNKGVIKEGGLSLCASIAAQEHGDARKAIDILRVAGELAEVESEKSVEEKHIRAAWKELRKSRVKEVIKDLPIQPKTALLAITQLAGEKGYTITGKVYERYKILCAHSASSPVTLRRLKEIIKELNMAGICDTHVLSRGYYGRTTKIQLALSLSDVKSALSEDELLAPLV